MEGEKKGWEDGGMAGCHTDFKWSDAAPDPPRRPSPSTLRSRCRTCISCMKRIPSQICRTNTMVSTSVSW